MTCGQLNEGPSGVANCFNNPGAPCIACSTSDLITGERPDGSLVTPGYYFKSTIGTCGTKVIGTCDGFGNCVNQISMGVCHSDLEDYWLGQGPRQPPVDDL
jgi:hypothetical protein